MRSAHQSNINNKKTCSLFVHVGDFLSLASIRGEGGYPMFPSPRHRVLSPIRRYDEDGSTSKSKGNSSSYVKDYCRRSLVYFAYPPPNVTLNAVQQVVSSILNPPTSSLSQHKLQIPMLPKAKKMIQNNNTKKVKSCIVTIVYYTINHNNNNNQHHQTTWITMEKKIVMKRIKPRQHIN